MSIQKTTFGKMPNGANALLYTLKNKNGLTVKITSYGGCITEILVPDKSGKVADVVLGFDNLDQYLKESPYFGATVGRYANRIAKGKFSLDGVEYTLPINNAPNSLHGGPRAFNNVNWQSEATGDALTLKHFSGDGDQGYPGNLHTTVVFSFSDTNDLRIDYEATTDKPTPINLTNHSYFNLAGAGSGTILDHVLTLNAKKYTPVDDTLIPTGQIAPVAGTPMDFTSPKPIGSRIDKVGAGYDHNYVLGDSGKLELAATVQEPKSGRVVEVLTTQPGIQFYTGNFLDGHIKGLGGAYGKHGAFCLETQHFPDSPNHPNFPDTILRPGETYKQTTVYRFSAK